MADVKITLQVNARTQTFQSDGEMPLLWFLRDQLQLKGTKFACGVGQCGACTVHVDGAAARSCLVPMSGMQGKQVTTIEGLAGLTGPTSGDTLHPVQQAWLDEDVAQCGYCQAGQIMATVELLRRKPQPSAADIAGITNLCRCGTHVRLHKAITLAARRMQGRA